jgi:hypothetical protein
MFLKRKHFAITAENMGLLRWAYLVLGAAGVVLAAIRFFFPPFFTTFLPSSMPAIRGFSPVLCFVVSLSLILAALIFGVYAYGRGRPNASYDWFSFQILGERRFGRLDQLLLVGVVILFVASLSAAGADYAQLIVFFLLVASLLANLFSHPDLDVLGPIGSPDPKPIPGFPDIPGPFPAPVEPGSEEAERYIFVDYRWTDSEGSVHEIPRFFFSKEAYEEAVEKNRSLLNEQGRHDVRAYHLRVSEGLTGDVRHLVYLISKTHTRYRTMKRLDNLLQFIHQFDYVSDAESKQHEEYGRFPVETLVEKKGDCDCLSIAAAALFTLHGFRSALIHISGHCLVGVEIPGSIPGAWVEKDGIRYFLCETTGGRWTIGQHPTGHLQDLEVCPV